MRLAPSAAAGLIAALALAVASAVARGAEAAPADAERCTALGDFRDAGVAVSLAEAIEPEGQAWTPPPGQGRSRPVTTSFCRIAGMIEGRVGFELWLPRAPAWNGRLLGAGVGGDAGVFNYHDLARGVTAGFAAITNDSGHKVAERDWMMRREAVLDYTHRSQHMMNAAARALIAAYYGRGPHHAYFVGCSGGGRQAYKEIQRYPEDYDGVIAGAGAPSMPEMSARHLWQALYQQRNPAGALGERDWDLVVEAAVEACDRNDGLQDGIVENPARCHFDPRQLQCRGGAAQRCLTPEQAQTVRTFYAPLRDENGRERDRGLVPGVRTRPGPPSPLLLPMFQQGAHQDLTWTAERFHIANDLALVDRTMPELRADDPDLRPFIKRGGRAIFYQGWLDPSVVAHTSISYYERVRKTIGAEASNAAIRLYMVPAMLHCRGGAGVDEFGGSSARLPIRDDPRADVLAALVRWVEEGVAPQEIIGARLEDEEVRMTRPICPYPEAARYRGGDPKRAESFRCEAPR